MGPTAPPRRGVRLRPAVLAGFALLAAGGWLGYRSWSHGADRRAALALAETAPPGEALPALRAALDQHPSDPALLRAATLALIRSGALVADVDDLSARWVAAAPDDPEAQRVRFDFLHRVYRSDEAAAVGERAVALAPADHATRAELARVYLVLGRPADAARELRALAAVPGLPHDAYAVGLAKAEADAGNRAEAARVLDALLARAPAHAEALALRADLHYQAGEDVAAAATARRVGPAADRKDRQAALYTLGLALARQGKADEAAAAFAGVRALQDADQFAADARSRPDDPGYQLRAAEARLAAGDPRGAADLAHAAVARSGASRAAFDLLARCYDRMNHPGPAAEARSRAATLP